jgi:hypothetical protein
VGRGAGRGYQSLDLTWTVVTGQGFLNGLPNLLFSYFLRLIISCWVCLLGMYPCNHLLPCKSTNNIYKKNYRCFFNPTLVIYRILRSNSYEQKNSKKDKFFDSSNLTNLSEISFLYS